MRGTTRTRTATTIATAGTTITTAGTTTTAPAGTGGPRGVRTARRVANTGARKPTARPASGGYREASTGARRHEPNDEPRSSRDRRPRSERHTPDSREETPASFGGEKPRGAPGFYNPTFYERKYDLGEARGVSTYERSGAGGYHGAHERPSEAQRRARSEGPYAGQYGMDYEPKRVSEYRRMLGEGGAYYKLGSLGGDLDTEAQRAAREKREAIKELDRVNREQNRLAAERSNASLAKKRGDQRGAGGGAAKRLERGFLSHVGDRDPRNPGKNQAPSKHERMWSYAKRHIPKPVPAPPKKAPPAPPRMHGVWKEPAVGAEAFAAAPEDNNFRGEWPSAWGGARGRARAAPKRAACGPRPARDAAAARRYARPGTGTGDVRARAAGDGAQDPPAEAQRAESGVVFERLI